MSFSTQNGKRLRAERERLGMSQEAFGEAAGVSRAMLSRYERGVAEPGASVLMGLMSVGVDIAYVLGSDTATAIEYKNTRELTPEQSALLDNYENADEEGRDAARRVLVALSKSKATKTVSYTHLRAHET